MIDKVSWEKAFGFKLIKEMFTIEEINKLIKETDILEKEKDRKNFIWKYYEKSSNSISRIEYFVNYSNFFLEFANNKKIINLVSNLMGEECILFKDKINFKYPGADSFVLHQDVTAGWGMYTNKHINIAIPYCDTNELNGNIFFGSRTPHMLTDYFEDLTKYNENLIPVKTKKGDAIIFDSYIPHASYENNSTNKRQIIFLTYTPKSQGSFYEKYHSDKFKVLPPDICKVKGQSYRSNNTNVKSSY